MAYDDGYGQRYEGYGQAPWLRVLLRALTASIRLGRFYGVEVRIYALALALLPLITLVEVWSHTAHAFEALLLATLIPTWLYLVVYTHEMGHVAMGWRYGVRTPLITLSPLGGLAHMMSAPPGPRAEMAITIAGPAVHLVWLAVVWPLLWLLDASYEWGLAGRALWVSLATLKDLNLWLLAFNLLPLFPMDGGRVLRAALAVRLHPNRATVIAAQVGMLGAVGLGLYGLFSPGYWGGILIAIAISNFLACRREVAVARFTDGPYAHSAPMESWQLDPDGWKAGGWSAEAGGGGGAGEAAGAGGPGPIGRWLAERRARRAEEESTRAAQRARTLESELDRVLARISEVGMAALTDDERQVLKEASEAKRKAREGR